MNDKIRQVGTIGHQCKKDKLYGLLVNDLMIKRILELDKQDARDENIKRERECNENIDC